MKSFLIALLFCFSLVYLLGIVIERCNGQSINIQGHPSPRMYDVTGTNLFWVTETGSNVVDDSNENVIINSR